MDEKIMASINDTHRGIGEVIGRLKEWESDLCDPRVKAIVLTKLEEAQLWSLKMIKDNIKPYESL